MMQVIIDFIMLGLVIVGAFYAVWAILIDKSPDIVPKKGKKL